MPVDYILEMIEELGRAMRAIIARKKDQPAKALEEIRVAFNGTKFGNKGFFDALSPEELAVFLREKQVDYRAADYIVDILLEEADIARDLELERLAMDMGREVGIEGMGKTNVSDGVEENAGAGANGKTSVLVTSDSSVPAKDKRSVPATGDPIVLATGDPSVSAKDKPSVPTEVDQATNTRDDFERKSENQNIQSIVYNEQQLLLLRKIKVMIDYTTEIETSLKIFSLKRGQQRERLNGFN